MFRIVIGICTLFTTATVIVAMSEHYTMNEQEVRVEALNQATSFCFGGECNPEFFAKRFEAYLKGEAMRPLLKPAKKSMKEEASI